MKEFNVAVITPTTGICRMGYAQSLCRLAMYFAQVRVFEDQPIQRFIPDSIEGSGIAENYQRLVTKYLNDKDTHWTHILCVEDDMGFAPDCLHILARHRLHIVGANYSTNKGAKQRFTAISYRSDEHSGVEPCVTGPDSSGLEEVSLLPQGMTLMAREVFEAIPKPWFLMGYDPSSDKYVYQDYYFSEQAKKAGFKLYVDHDVSKRLHHTGPHNYTWQDAYRDEMNRRKETANGNIG